MRDEADKRKLAALEEVEQLAGQAVEVARATEWAVHSARSSGATWREIATRLGCSRQAAHERFRHLASSTGSQPVLWREPPLPLPAASGGRPRSAKAGRKDAAAHVGPAADEERRATR